MEFFGITLYGPQNYIRDTMRPYYNEPSGLDDVEPLMKEILKNTHCPENVERPVTDKIRLIDCYLGRVNGFAYGSMERFDKMKKKGAIKPAGPADIYRVPPTSSIDFGLWLCDPALANKTWYQTYPRFPQPMSPNTKILDIVRKNNKYATFF